MSDEKQKELFSRNWAFVGAELQEELAASTLLVAGTGLGSVVAAVAARTGFGGFIIADGDRVELSNLNRQGFVHRDLGRNKAAATADVLLGINPEIRLQVIEEFLTAEMFAELSPAADMIVNTIDWDDPAWLDCNLQARLAGRPVLFPVNIGWGGILYVLPPEADPTDELTRLFLEPHANPGHARQQIILRAVQANFPAYLRELLPAFLDSDQGTGSAWPYDPQLAAATHVTAAMVTRAAVALVSGERLPVVPHAVHIDLVQLMESRNGGVSP